MKVREGTQGNKQKDHQADDGANEEIGEEEKRARETCWEEKKKAMESQGALRARGGGLDFRPGAFVPFESPQVPGAPGWSI